MKAPFATSGVPENSRSRKTQGATRGKAAGLWEHPASRARSSREQPGSSRGAYKKGTPPPHSGSIQSFHPHNFSRHKSRKKFAPRKHNFSHPKYRKKSPWSDWKKFRKKFVGKCFGEEKAPNLVERGRETLKYERIKFGAKIVKLFGIARGEFFHFVFVP